MWFARLSSCAAFFLLAAGGMVTSTGSGLAVPDWPLSYGQYFPRMAGGVFFEHGHRMIAGAVGLMTWALAAWIWRAEPRRWVRLLAGAAAFGIVVQAALGGITVLYGLPPAVSIVHACLGQALFCALLALAEATGWDPAAPLRPSRSWRLGAATVGVLYLQLILGALLRHTGGGAAWHVAWAFVATAHLGALIRRSVLSPAPGLAWWMLGLLPLQLLLGVAALAARSQRAILWSSAIPTAHLACGAALLGLSVLWTMRELRAGDAS